MPVVKFDYPILEYDTQETAVIEPNHRKLPPVLPPVCVLTFFGEVLNDFLSRHETEILLHFESEMRLFPVYGFTFRGVPLCVVQAVVGSASIAAMADYLFAYGAKTLLACGGCGVLCDIPAGDVILPTSALRDEGASYHYLPPSREIELDGDIVLALKENLE